MAQSHINKLQHEIANINDVQVRNIKNSLKDDDYINSTCPDDWVMFQIPNTVYFTHLMNGSNKTSAKLDWMSLIPHNEYVPLPINQN